MPSMVGFNWEISLVVMEQAITGRETPQARPRAILLVFEWIESRHQCEVWIWREKKNYFATETFVPGHKDIGHILIFAKQRQVQKDFDGLGIGSHDNHFGNTSIQGFGRFVGPLLCLLVVHSLLHQIQQGDGKFSISERKSFFRHGGEGFSDDTLW